MTRVTTLGELTASITHDINQPLAAMATNANAALRWLSSDSPNLVEAHEAIRRIVRDGDASSAHLRSVRSMMTAEKNAALLPFAGTKTRLTSAHIIPPSLRRKRLSKR